MRIVDDHQRRTLTPEALHAPGGRFDLGEKADRRLQGGATHQQDTEHAEQVRSVERADQTRVDLALAPRRLDREGEARAARGEVRADDVCGPEAVGQYLAAAAARRVDQALTERIVGVDHAEAQARPGEELRFRRAVRGHRSVVIEMIARKVGEQRDVEGDAVDASLIEPVRGDLHCCRLCAD